MWLEIKDEEERVLMNFENVLSVRPFTYVNSKAQGVIIKISDNKEYCAEGILYEEIIELLKSEKHKVITCNAASIR